MDAAEFSELCKEADSDARMAAMLLNNGNLAAAHEYADLFATKNVRILAYIATQERTVTA